MERLLLLVMLCLCCCATEGQQTRRIVTSGSAEREWFRPTGIRITGSNQLVFQAKGSRDAVLGLATEDSDNAIHWYIAVGGHNDTVDCVQARVQGRLDQRFEKHCRQISLSPTEYSTFWLSWDHSSIRLGYGNTVGGNQYCEQSSPDTNTPTDFYLRLGSYGRCNTINWIVQLPRTPATRWPSFSSPDGTDVSGSDIFNVVPGDARVVTFTGHQSDPVAIANVVATEVAGFVKTENYMKVIKGLRMIGQCLSYFFNAIADMVSVASESETMLLEMSKGFKEVNVKLEDVQDQVTTLGNIIDGQLRKQDFNAYARKIKILSGKLDVLFDQHDLTGFESKRREFVRDYEFCYYDNNYDSEKFVNFLTDAEFFNSYVISTGNYRRKVLDQMKVVLYYVTQATKIEAVYLRLKGESWGETQLWENTLTRVHSQMIEIDNRVKRAYTDQAKGEIENFLSLRNHRGLSHSEFSNRLVNFLSEKYFWREWFVASYNETDGDDQHAVDGWYWRWVRTNGRNLVVSSLMANDYYITKIAYSAVSALRRKCQPGQLVYPTCCQKSRAKYLSDNISRKGGLNMKLVVQDGRGLYAVSSQNCRLIEHKRIKRCADYFDVVTFM